MKLGGYLYVQYPLCVIDFSELIATMTHEEYSIWLYEGTDL